MKATIQTGFRKGKKFMNGSPLRALLCCALVLGALAGCGEPQAPGLGDVSVTNGGDFTRSPSSGPAPCTFTNMINYFSIFVTKTNLNAGNLVFGSDSILDIQAPPPDESILANADVAVYVSQAGGFSDLAGLSSFTLEVADDIAGTFGAVSTTGQSAIINTGSDGVVIVRLTLATITVQGDFQTTVSFFPAIGGTEFEFNLEITCS